jgi:hypothetical protein
LKAILEFDLPDENPEFQLATNASKLMMVVDDIKNYCRNRLKYSSDPLSELHEKDLLAIQEMLSEVHYLE